MGTNEIDMPDLFEPEVPQVEVKEEIIEDEFEGAFKYAFVGLGQGGGKIANAFWDLGYRRVCAINTAKEDLASLSLPNGRKLAVAEGGAGKDPAVAAAAVKKVREEIYDFIRRTFGNSFDRIIVCVGCGGGSGSGSCLPIVDICHDVLRSLKIEKKGQKAKVGAILALPKNSEGRRPAENTFKLLRDVFQQSGVVGNDVLSISPIFLVDNERIKQVYPGLPVSKFWDQANKSIVNLFHLFNTISIKKSEFVSFDRADLETVLDSGIVSFGAVPIPKWKDKADISQTMRATLVKNVLVSCDVATAKAGGVVFVGGSEVLDNISEDNLDHGFEMMGRIMKDNGILHRGIYRGSDANKLVVYTILGGMEMPEDRMGEIADIGLIQDK